MCLDVLGDCSRLWLLRSSSQQKQSLDRGPQAMHFMLPGMDGMARAPQSDDDADAFKARLDAIKVRR